MHATQRVLSGADQGDSHIASQKAGILHQGRYQGVEGLTDLVWVAEKRSVWRSSGKLSMMALTDCANPCARGIKFQPRNAFVMEMRNVMNLEDI